MKKLLLLSCCILFACQTSEKSHISSEEVLNFQNKIIHHPSFIWEKLETENYMIYVPKDSGLSLGQLGTKVEESGKKVLQLLQEENQIESGGKPVLFYLETRDQMKQLVGQPAGGWTETRQNTIFVVQNDEVPAPLRHEFGHLYSWRTWGKPAGYWLSEGLAVYASGECEGINLHTWAAAMHLKQELKPLKELQENWDFSKAAPHLEAGSFVKYIIENYGIKAFIKIWKKGMGVSLEVTGKTADALEKEWIKFLNDPELVKVAREEAPDFSAKVRCM